VVAGAGEGTGIGCGSTDALGERRVISARRRVDPVLHPGVDLEERGHALVDGRWLVRDLGAAVARNRNHPG
jgi:hypothetical protein